MRWQPLPIRRGTQAKNAKLTDEKVREIRRRCEAGELQKDVARDVGISQNIVSKIMTRDRWTHVQ